VDLKQIQNQFLGPGIVSHTFVELAMVAERVDFSGHRYIPGGTPAFFFSR
jgi:hypothetical protein